MLNRKSGILKKNSEPQWKFNLWKQVSTCAGDE